MVLQFGHWRTAKELLHVLRPRTTHELCVLKNFSDFRRNPIKGVIKLSRILIYEGLRLFTRFKPILNSKRSLNTSFLTLPSTNPFAPSFPLSLSPSYYSSCLSVSFSSLLVNFLNIHFLWYPTSWKMISALRKAVRLPQALWSFPIHARTASRYLVLARLWVGTKLLTEQIEWSEG